ncbi:hypothetical protein VM1G_11805 [Cytospora mali]|uniref:Uncharacterized protein n=1 Tax=Cytospora mali TaxID=578113 RepID=A0A194W777_CYTMA|nr:hypothetical protein VM1G_11805 [Valsa mali]
MPRSRDAGLPAAGLRGYERDTADEEVASKAATVMMMKSMAAEWGEHGIRANALSPVYIQTVVNEGEELEELSK